jgi:1-acyl-sn-glycerol-3-phosphate acyltransferase
MNGVVAPPPGRRDDSLPSIWSRRAVSLPLLAALGALAGVTAPLWIVGGLAADAVTGKARLLPRTRAMAFFALYLACEFLGVAAAAGLWLLSLGGRVGGPRRYVDLNAALQRRWTAALFGGATRLFSMRVEVEGLDLARTGPLLLFVRHSSTADTVLAAALVANPNRLLLRYVLKRELLWDPCLDIVGRRLPNAFVDRASPRSQGEIEAVARLARDLDSRSAVLIYPEGTRFSPAKRKAAVEMLRSKGKLDLAALAAGYLNVLPPRVGGPLALLDAAPGVDLLLVEHTGAASFHEFWSGKLVGKTVRVRLRRIPASEIPDTGRDRWLFERWVEVDRWISAQIGRAA